MSDTPVLDSLGLLAMVAVSIQMMRIAVLLLALFASPLWAQTTSASSPLDLPLEQRLDLPRRVASASLRLTDFIAFIATTFKVPLLVETPAPVPDLKTPAGTYSARQLLDMGDNSTSQIHVEG